MLCNSCQAIDFSNSILHRDKPEQFTVDGDEPHDSKPGFLTYKHHPSIGALRIAAIAGCHLCTQIRQELYHIRGHESDEARHDGPIELRYYPKADKNGNVMLSQKMLALAQTTHREVKVPFDLLQFSPSMSALLSEKASNNNLSTGCEENIKLACTWLRECLESHELCTLSTVSNPPLPTRILDLESPNNSDDLQLCSSEGRRGPYITLSHVWGPMPVITTTKSTLQARMTAITCKSLPKTFRDAVAVARQMAIRYLWLDSICIVQDSLDDWEKESSKMGGYYLNSLFTVAAVCASEGSEGLFMSRNSLEVTPCPINIRLPGIAATLSEPLFLRPSLGWDPVKEIAGFQRPPLWQRAWVVQERMLSARLLQFSRMQLSWKCRTKEASERQPECKPAYTSKGDTILGEALLGMRRHALDEAESFSESVTELHATENIDLYNAWYDLVMLYGKCNLTKESDIFPAISGIAKEIASSTGDQYLAGLWGHDLHRGLLWTAPDSTNSSPDLRNYRAPSWSWASLKKTCTFYVREIVQRQPEQCFEIFRYTSGASMLNPYGQVSTGVLEVVGLLKQAHPKGLDGEEVFTAVSSVHNRETLFDLEGKHPIGHYFADNIDRRYLTEIWCFPVMTEERYVPRRATEGKDVQPSHPQIEARCLALFDLNKSERMYMRVGLVWILDFEWFHNCEMMSFSVV